MRRTSSLALLASTLIGTSVFASACEDGDDANPDPATGGSSSGGSNTGGASGGSSGTTGGTGDAGSGTTGGRGGSAGGGGVSGSSQGGDAGAETGGSSPGGMGGEGGGEGGFGGEVACGIDTIGEAERALIGHLGPLPAVPADPTNAYADNAGARALGQRFFFDKAFSGPLAIDSDLGTTGQSGKVACSSCHLGESMEDHRSMPPEVSRAAGVHARNAPGSREQRVLRLDELGGAFLVAVGARAARLRERRDHERQPPRHRAPHRGKATRRSTRPFSGERWIPSSARPRPRAFHPRESRTRRCRDPGRRWRLPIGTSSCASS